MNANQTDTRRVACPGPDEWSAFYLGQLPDAAVQILAEHLDRCPTCVSYLVAA